MDFRLKAKAIRKSVFETIGAIGGGHIGGSLSIVDVLTVLYQTHAHRSTESS